MSLNNEDNEKIEDLPTDGQERNPDSKNDISANDAPEDGKKEKLLQSNGAASKAKAKTEKAKQKITDSKQKAQDKANPPGGYDSTPIPYVRDGYTVRFTFHRAENLPIADLKAQSSDPYLTATLTAPSIRPRHKEDPVMCLRTRTIHKSTAPEWNQQWVVAGIPLDGFKIKCRLYDEDPADHDDRLGNVTIYVNNIGPEWKGIREEGYDIKKRMGSKRAYAWKGCLTLVTSAKMGGTLYVSMELLGKSDPPHGRMYTIGPCQWTKHNSPMIGRLTGTKAPSEIGTADHPKKSEKYDFQANQIQLQGPVPPELYHRFVEFKPFVKGMFARTGFRGRILNKALHHQHARVYNYSSTTEYGTVEPHSEEAAQKFLDLVHHDEGGRIFTYVVTLDGLWRFTETGKEFGIDLLSKHTMHSDVNIYIACSGEFFVRRLAHPNEASDAPNQKTHPSKDLPGGPPNEPPPKSAKNYQLVIDNDSGTYRPKGDLLPKLKEFLNLNLPGLHVMTKECTDDDLTKMKDKQRQIKKSQGQNVDLVQNSDDEISSSDEEALDRRERQGKDGPTQKSRREKAFAAVEDPVKALQDMIPGHAGKKKREERETEEDMATA